jgi:hypothetical protein
MSMRALLHNQKIPKEVRHAFSQAIVSRSAEQILWREVAARHTLDAFGIVGQDEASDMIEARDWFENCYDDVHLLFEFAGVDPIPVVACLVKFLKEKTA